MAELVAAENIDGDSVATLLVGGDPGWKDEAIIDFTSAGSLHPWRAIRQGRHKYVNVFNEAPLLFDLQEDPDEWHNLAGQPELTEVESALRLRTEVNWDPAVIEAGELRRQQERLFILAAHGQGTPVSWDCQPYFDASQQYTR